MKIRFASGLLLLVLLGSVSAVSMGCTSAAPVAPVKPGTVWESSASGLPVLYVFGDPS